MMNIKQLESLCAFSETLSFTKAAERVFLSQSAYSREISALERELNCELIVRSRKDPKLTLAGERIVNSAKLVLNEIDSIIHTAEKAKSGNLGELKIGVLPHGISEDVLSLLHNYAKANPEIRLEISEYPEHDLVRAVESGKEDFCIVIRHDDISPQLFKSCIIDSCPQCVVVNEEHPLSTRNAVNFAELSQEEFIIVKENVFQKGFDYIMRKGLENNFIPKIAAKADSMFGVSVYVNCDQGVAIAAEAAKPIFASHVKFVPISDLEPLAYRLVWITANRSNQVKSFLSHIKKILPEGIG